MAVCPAAWEVTPADPAEYWRQVPDAVKLTLHYYNVPCSVEPESEFNPLRIVRTLYQPGDFVVIKVSGPLLSASFQRSFAKSCTVRSVVLPAMPGRSLQAESPA